MQYLIYRSTALIGRDSPENRSILVSSLRNNAAFDLTGYLHREDNTFLQYLEGPTEALNTIFARIRRDPRHSNVEVMGTGALDIRRFGGWRMAFGDDHVASFHHFLRDAWGKTRLQDATAQEAMLFMFGACQRLDLGLAS